MRNQSFEMTDALIGPPSMDAINIRHRGSNIEVNTAVIRRVVSGAPPAIDGSSDGWGGADLNISLWAGNHTLATTP
jgi:hypothetical protein